jgi:predicted ATPase
LTSFVGRERDVAQARNLLWRADVRLLTLTGPPGIGKTRLGLAVAAAVRGEFAHGGWLVPLAPISDPALVLPTVAQTLGLQETADQGIERVLAAFLRDRQLLLVLDNFEQVVDAAPALTGLLAHAPRVKALVTSRAPLRVYGEHEFPVPPLDLPAAPPDGAGVAGPGGRSATGPPVAALGQVAAVALFVQRAQAARPDFTLTTENAAAVAAICRRLDGLPLAIELAAARSKLFSPAALLDRLADAPLLELLAGGPRDRTDRQRTLRGAIEWSYNLLTEEEQRLFRRLAAFVGGRAPEAVEAVCNAEGDLGVGVWDGLVSLAEKNLLQQQEGFDGAPRFWMLVTIHSYARERLTDSGEAEAVRRRHAAYYLALVERAEPHLRGAEQQQWLDRLESEHDNLRAALGWALACGEGALAQRLAGPLWRFWSVRGYLTEGRAWLARAREADAARTPARAVVCRAAGTLAQAQSDYSAARRLLEEALSIFRERDDRLNEARTLNNLGIVEYEQGDLEAARATYTAVLQIQRALDEQWGLAAALTNLGMVAMDLNDPAAARGYHTEALALFRELKDRRGATAALNNLAVLAHQEGNYAAARAMWQECAATYREFGYKESLGLALANLGVAARDEGAYDEARALYTEGLALLREVGNLRVIGHALDRLAGLAVLEAQPEKAARLFGAAEALLRNVKARLPTYNQQEHDRFEARARARLGAARFAALRREGSALSTADAIDYALNSGSRPDAAPGAGRG